MAQKTRQSWGRILILIQALITLRCGAQTVAYSTLGPLDNLYNASGGWLVNGSSNPPEPYVAEASQFVPTASGYLTEVDLALSAGNDNLSADIANVYVTANNSQNLPGTILDSYLNVPCMGTFGEDNPLTSLMSTANPYLQSGQTYWLLIRPATTTADISVNENSQGILTTHDVYTSEWYQEGAQTTFAFDVESTAPEPSALGLFAAGGALVLGYCRRSVNASRRV